MDLQEDNVRIMKILSNHHKFDASIRMLKLPKEMPHEIVLIGIVQKKGAPLCRLLYMLVYLRIGIPGNNII